MKVTSTKQFFSFFFSNFRATTERCEHDLKQTLSKDITKLICEKYVFYLYDKWWQEQEEKYKEKVNLLENNIMNIRFKILQSFHSCKFELSINIIYSNLDHLPQLGQRKRMREVIRNWKKLQVLKRQISNLILLLISLWIALEM